MYLIWLRVEKQCIVVKSFYLTRIGFGINLFHFDLVLQQLTTFFFHSVHEWCGKNYFASCFSPFLEFDAFAVWKKFQILNKQPWDDSYLRNTSFKLLIRFNVKNCQRQQIFLWLWIFEIDRHAISNFNNTFGMEKNRWIYEK